MTSISCRLGLGAIAALASACAGDIAEPVDQDSAEVGSERAEIRGGRARNDHPAIGRVWMRTPRKRDKLGFCTATLVDRRVAITAGHCVNLGTSSKPGDQGFLEIFREEWDD